MRGRERGGKEGGEVEKKREGGGKEGGEVNSSHMHPPVPGPWQAGEK